MDDPDESTKTAAEQTLTRLLLRYFRELRERIVQEAERVGR
jgi:hypothetical protein